MTSRRRRQLAAKSARRITKSGGVTESEHLLSRLCERSFLNLWSYPNPRKDDGHELCDVLAAFDNHVFVFFDRSRKLELDKAEDPDIAWDRWKRTVVDKQVKTVKGAVRYLLSGRKVFVDPKCQTELPVAFDPTSAVYHKIIVANGAESEIKNASPMNINGSLAISYGATTPLDGIPFLISLDKDDPVHVLDSFTLPVVLEQLDTIFDLSEYLQAKEDAIAKLDAVFYCGEEDLLAHYYSNFDESTNKHFVGSLEEDYNALFIAEGEWIGFAELEAYKRTKKANEISYLWDDLLQHTGENALRGELMGNGDPFKGKSALVFMAREPRFSRRSLSEAMANAIRTFPDDISGIQRMVSLMPSFYPEVAYVFLQLWVPGESRNDEYRGKRQRILEIACGAAKLSQRDLRVVIGIAIDAPKHTDRNSEDFILMQCDSWTDEDHKEFEKLNADWQFFRRPELKMRRHVSKEFVDVDDKPSEG